MVGDVRSWVVRTGLLGGAVCAGTIGATIAHADGLDVGAADLGAETVPPVTTSYPLELLGDAAGNLTHANTLLTAGVTDIPGLSLQPDIQDHALNIITSLSTAETSLDAFDNGAFADLLTPWFNTVDQGLLQGTDALLAADTAMEQAISSASGVDEALFGVLGANLQLGGDLFNALPITFVDGLALGLIDFGFIDPAMVANIL